MKSRVHSCIHNIHHISVVHHAKVAVFYPALSLVIFSKQQRLWIFSFLGTGGGGGGSG